MVIIIPIQLGNLLREVIYAGSTRLEVSGSHLPVMTSASGDSFPLRTTVTEQEIHSWRRDLCGEGGARETVIKVMGSEFLIRFLASSTGFISLTADRA